MRQTNDEVLRYLIERDKVVEREQEAARKERDMLMKRINRLEQQVRER